MITPEENAEKEVVLRWGEELAEDLGITLENKIKTITLQEFSKLKLPQDRWLIKDILPREGFVIIASPSGEKKTWVALSMAGAIANGKDFLGHDGFKTSQGQVLYIDEEMSDTELQRRVNLLGLGDTVENIYLSRKNNLNFNEREDEQIEELFEFVEKHDIKAIFIDTFRSVAGGLKEDKAEDIRAYLDKFRPFKNNGVVVVFLDHCRKPAPREGSIPKKEQLLGSQDKLASVEALFMIKSEEESGDILVYPRKSRNGKEYPPFRIQMNEDCDDHGESTSIELIYKGKLEEKEMALDGAKRAVISILSSSKGMKRQEIITALKEVDKMGTRNVSSAIRILEDNKEIILTKVGRENFYEIGGGQSTEDIFSEFDSMDN